MNVRYKRMLLVTCLFVLLSAPAAAASELETENTGTEQVADASEPPVTENLEQEESPGTDSPVIGSENTDVVQGEQGTEKPDVQETFPTQEPETIAVTDISISDYDDVLEVDNTLTLTATVFPADATEQTIFYSSSDTAIATVSQTGEVKGISAGSVTITVSSGAVEKKIALTVKVSAKLIEVNKSYVLLKPDETFQLKASILPKNATNRALTYSSGDTAVATVSNTGLITAKSYGSTNIIIKNEDTLTAVTIIVNDDPVPETEIIEEDLARDEHQFEEYMTIAACPIVDCDMLQYLYTNKKDLYIEAEDYVLKIPGEWITNFSNQVKTDISLKTEQDSISFTLNCKKGLCGTVSVCIYGADEYKYLYLYNNVTEKYDLIRKDNLSEIDLTSPGEYLLVKQPISRITVSWWWIGLSGLVVLILLVVYICLKKKHWLW